MTPRSTPRHRSIPVNVVVERRPKARPTKAPIPAPVIAPPAPAPTTTWSAHHRRRMMWIIVGIGTLVILFGWIALFSAQLRGSAPTFFGDVANMVREVQWPWEAKNISPQEQEIRQLEEQVFPQFQ